MVSFDRVNINSSTFSKICYNYQFKIIFFLIANFPDLLIRNQIVLLIRTLAVVYKFLVIFYCFFQIFFRFKQRLFQIVENIVFKFGVLFYIDLQVFYYVMFVNRVFFNDFMEEISFGKIYKPCFERDVRDFFIFILIGYILLTHLLN